MTDVTEPVPSAGPARETPAAAAPSPVSTPGEALRAADGDVRDAMFDATHGQAVESAEALQEADSLAGIDRVSNVFDGSSPSADPEDVAADPDGSTPVDGDGAASGDAPGSTAEPTPVTSEPARSTSEPTPSVEEPTPVTSEPSPSTSEPAGPGSTTYSEEAGEPVTETPGS